MIQLNFGETVELKVLVDYVAKRLDMNVLYDEQVGNKLVTIKSPGQIPRSTLLGLLESVLRMKGLVLVDADEPGWKRIVVVNDMGAFAKADSELRTGARAVTQVFRLSNLDGKQAEQMIQPLLTKPGGNVIGIPRQPILIVTDFASNLPRIEQVLGLIDEPRGGVVMQAYTVRHAVLSDLSRVVQDLVTARYRAEWGGGQDNGSQVSLTPIPHANQIVAVGVQGQVDEAMGLMADLDVPERLVTRAYQFQYAKPAQINTLVQGLLDPATRQGQYRFVIDEELGLLAVATTETVHAQIQRLAEDLDAAPMESQNPVRIYKLLNTEAADVLATIRSLEGNVGFASYLTMDDAAGISEGTFSPPATDTVNLVAEAGDGSQSPLFENQPPGQRPLGIDNRGAVLLPANDSDVRVAVDEHTNSILVIAPPAEQKIYERLIKLLDQRRPQVLIEAIIVTLDTSNGYSFGVEIGASGSAGGVGGEYITFSSFGLSKVDATTGSLALTPGLGFNGTLLSSDIADVVLRALKTNGRASVVSSPRILVNDNTPGTLSSVAAEPFAAVVDSSNNTSTTTLGGSATAGTIITVTPRISVDDYLQLEYELELSNFTGDRSANLPPPSQQNKISSDVTIPDGHTIVVGGINRLDTSNTISSIPFLGEVPLLKHLVSSQDSTHREQTLFVFIRPVILRDDRFADLKYLSGKDRDLAGMEEAYPSSEPLLVY
ncbi:MAG: secretin N-terminal domain-containing protein [Phycisphaerales bacterium]